MRYLSLFSGIGGFELGLENSVHDFECIGASEIDSYAKAIYFRHFPQHKDLGDASEIDPAELQDFDLLVGGFPCQAFSLSGYRRGFGDCRGTLFFEIARICEEKKPKYLVLENVKGLLSHDRGRTFKKMLRVLSELGYDVEWEVLNSKDFHTAQNRERLYIKGYLRDKCGGEILSAKRTDRKTTIQRLKAHKFDRQVKKRIHDCDYNELSAFLRNHRSAVGVSMSEIARQLNRSESEVEHWFRQDKYFAPPPAEVWHPLKQMLDIADDKYDAFITEFEWIDGVYDYDKRAYDDEGLAPTLTTHSETLAKINIVGNLSRTGHMGDAILGVDGISSTLTATNYKHPLRIKTNTNKGYDEVVDGDGVRLCHPTSTKARGRTQKGQTGALSTKADWGTVDKDFRIRKLTPIECERLQAFPDNWTKWGADGEEISDTQRYKCLGNAVTTTVVTYIADTMFGGSTDGM